MSLSEPSFIERNLEVIIERIKSRYEQKTGSVLSPMHPFFLFIEAVSYELFIHRIGVQDAAKQNLLDFARFPMIDYLGELKKTERLQDETDDSYRERIRKAPEKFSTCGPVGAYIEWAKSVSSSIIDVEVFSEVQSGIAELYILTKEKWTATQLIAEKAKAESDKTKINGINLEILMQQLLDAVLFVCSDDKVRPMTEKVEVYLPEVVEYEIVADIVLYKDALPTMNRLMDQLRVVAADFAANLENKLASGIVRSQIIQALKAAGVYKINLVSPTIDTDLSYKQFAHCTNIQLNHVGVVQ